MKKEILLTEEEIKDLIKALTFAHNHGKTPEEFGSLRMIQKLKNKLKELRWD